VPPSSPRHFVRVHDEVRGPYDVAQLRDLAEAGVVTPDTPAASQLAGPWAALGGHPERDVIFPPRVELPLKPATLPAASDANAPRVILSDIIAAAVTGDRVLRPSHPPDLAAYQAAKTAGPLNEVQEMVRAVNEREAQFAPPPPPPPQRPLLTRRAKTILVLALIGNSLLLAIPFAYDALGDMWSMVIIRGLDCALQRRPGHPVHGDAETVTGSGGAKPRPLAPGL
jgi:hypothetical protein